MVPAGTWKEHFCSLGSSTYASERLPSRHKNRYTNSCSRWVHIGFSVESTSISSKNHSKETSQKVVLPSITDAVQMKLGSTFLGFCCLRFKALPIDSMG